MGNRFTIKIKRRAGREAEPYWERFELSPRPGMNVVVALREIRENPVTKEGRKTDPVAWECSCLEEVCGACAMLINGTPMQACSALIERLDLPLTLEPLSSFPVVRDLVVDRSSIYDGLKSVKAWIPVDGTHGTGPGPRMGQELQEEAYPLSRCITCGCCMEACPQVNDRSPFMGAAVLNQVSLLSMHPTGMTAGGEMLAAVRGRGGLSGCANSQNCARVCPKGIPLVRSIALLNRRALADGVRRWLSR